MRIGVVVDSSCDLPPEFLEQNNIRVLPNTIRVGADALVDVRDPEATLGFFSSHIGDKSHDAETTPFSVEQIQKVFLEQLVLDFDFVFCVTVWSKRSHVFENATKASFAILSSYRKTRNEAGVTGPFSMRVLDSKTLFAGVGVIAAEAVRLAKEGLQPNEIRTQLDNVVNNTVTLMVPTDLAYIRIRATRRGEKSVGAVGAFLAGALDIKPILCAYREETKPVAKVRGYEPAVEKMLRHVAERVRGGDLVSRYVVVSYGGELAEIRRLPAYLDLEKACVDREVTLMSCIMSASAAVNVGAGALSVSYVGADKPIH